MAHKKRKLTPAAISKTVREVRTECSRMTEAERDSAIERLLKHARASGAIIPACLIGASPAALTVTKLRIGFWHRRVKRMNQLIKCWP